MWSPSSRSCRSCTATGSCGFRAPPRPLSGGTVCGGTVGGPSACTTSSSRSSSTERAGTSRAWRQMVNGFTPAEQLLLGWLRRGRCFIVAAPSAALVAEFIVAAPSAARVAEDHAAQADVQATSHTTSSSQASTQTMSRKGVREATRQPVGTTSRAASRAVGRGRGRPRQTSPPIPRGGGEAPDPGPDPHPGGGAGAGAGGHTETEPQSSPSSPSLPPPPSPSPPPPSSPSLPQPPAGELLLRVREDELTGIQAITAAFPDQVAAGGGAGMLFFRTRHPSSDGGGSGEEEGERLQEVPIKIRAWAASASPRLYPRIGLRRSVARSLGLQRGDRLRVSLEESGRVVAEKVDNQLAEPWVRHSAALPGNLPAAPLAPPAGTLILTYRQYIAGAQDLRRLCGPAAIRAAFPQQVACGGGVGSLYSRAADGSLTPHLLVVWVSRTTGAVRLSSVQALAESLGLQPGDLVQLSWEGPGRVVAERVTVGGDGDGVLRVVLTARMLEKGTLRLTRVAAEKLLGGEEAGASDSADACIPVVVNGQTLRKQRKPGTTTRRAPPVGQLRRSLDRRAAGATWRLAGMLEWFRAQGAAVGDLLELASVRDVAAAAAGEGSVSCVAARLIRSAARSAGSAVAATAAADPEVAAAVAESGGRRFTLAGSHCAGGQGGDSDPDPSATARDASNAEPSSGASLSAAECGGPGVGALLDSAGSSGTDGDGTEDLYLRVLKDASRFFLTGSRAIRNAFPHHLLPADGGGAPAEPAHLHVCTDTGELLPFPVLVRKWSRTTVLRGASKLVRYMGLQHGDRLRLVLAEGGKVVLVERAPPPAEVPDNQVRVGAYGDIPVPKALVAQLLGQEVMSGSPSGTAFPVHVAGQDPGQQQPSRQAVGKLRCYVRQSGGVSWVFSRSKWLREQGVAAGDRLLLELEALPAPVGDPPGQRDSGEGPGAPEEGEGVRTAITLRLVRVRAAGGDSGDGGVSESSQEDTA